MEEKRLDWFTIPKIDAHIHLMPQDVIDANIGDKFADYGDVSEYIKLMDKYNITTAFIMPFNDPYMLSMDFTLESVHSNLYNMCNMSNGRLYSFADIDIRKNLDKNISELNKIINKTVFLGIKIHPTNTGYPIDGEYYDKIFEWASDNNVLVEIHSYPRTHINDDVCSPSRIKNVIKKYSNLKVSIAHMGGFQYEQLYDINACFNISAILPDYVNEYGIKKTNNILREFGIEKLVFATDYPDSRSLKPDEIYNKYFDILNKMDFTYEEAEKICRYNIMNMIKR